MRLAWEMLPVVLHVPVPIYTVISLVGLSGRPSLQSSVEAPAACGCLYLNFNSLILSPTQVLTDFMCQTVSSQAAPLRGHAGHTAYGP